LNFAFYKENIKYTLDDAYFNLRVADSGSGKEDSSHNSWAYNYYVNMPASSSEPRKHFYALGEEAVIFKCIQDKSSIKFYNEKVDPSQNSFLARYLRISDIQDNRIQDSMSYIVSMDRDLSEYELRARDVLIAKVLPVKTTMLAASDNRRIYPDGNFFIIRLKEDSELTPGYLKGYLESKAGKRQLEQLASGGSMLAVTKGALERLEIPYKLKEEQDKYNGKYAEYQNLLQQLQQQIQDTKEKMDNLISSDD
jgi:restriction endonuclease S subunit